MNVPPGYRSTVAVLAATQTLSWAILYYGFSSFVLPMREALGWGEATLMGALTLGLAVWGAATYAVGAAIDHGHGRAVMTTGSLLAAAGCLGWSQITQPWMLYAVWVALGAAMAMTLYDPAFNVLTKRYPQHYRQGITTLTLVAGFASTLSFPAVGWLISGLGWRQALMVLALVLAAVVAPLQAWALRGPALVAASTAQVPQDDSTLRQALRSRVFWLLGASFTLHSFASAAMWAHVMPIFAGKGMSAAQAPAVLVWIGPAQVLGRFVYAAGGTGLSLRHLGLLVMLGMPLAMLLLAESTQWLSLLLFAGLFGLANGLITIVRGGLVPEYFGRTHIGRISGAMSALGLLARAAAPLLTAWLLLAAPGYRQVLWVLASLGVAAVVAFALARKPG